MAPLSVTRASRIWNPAVAGTGVQPNGQNPPQEEQEVSQNEGEKREVPLAPPPPLGDLAQIIHNQTIILETLANALVNKQPQEQTMNDKLMAFLRTKPLTFAGSSNPLDADDWLRVIQRKLEPFECQDREKSSSGNPLTHRDCLILVGELRCCRRRCLHHHLEGICQGIPPISYSLGHHEAQGG